MLTYDAWKLSGDTRITSDTFECHNDDCDMFGVPVTESVATEYGYTPTPECRMCAAPMERS